MTLPDDAFVPPPLEHLEDTLQETAAEFDDEVLERALRTVSWNPRDVANYLRTSRAQ